MALDAERVLGRVWDRLVALHLVVAGEGDREGANAEGGLRPDHLTISQSSMGTASEPPIRCSPSFLPRFFPAS